MPENFEIAYPWVFVLILLPFLIYGALPPIKNRSSALKFPYFLRASEVTNQKNIRYTVLIITWVHYYLGGIS